MTRNLILLPALILILGTTVERKIKNQLQNPFDKLQYDKVVAYDYDGQVERPIVTEKGELVKFDGRHGAIFMTKELTKKQISEFNQITGDTATYGGIPASCFDPHLGIVYYMKNKIVGHISICFGCNFLQASIEIPATNFKKYIVQGDTPMELTAYGFSKLGATKLSNFCKSLGFDHCNFNPDSPFFKRN